MDSNYLMPCGPDKGKPLKDFTSDELRVMRDSDWIPFQPELLDAVRKELHSRATETGCPGGMEIDWDNPETGRILDEADDRT